MGAWAQPAERITSRSEYILKWKDEAIRNMNNYGIPASITLAQGILESANGNSALAKYGNNHFGIKCHNWDGETIHKDDDHKDDCFRSYGSAEESFKDHSEFLTKRGRYEFLFDYKVTDYKSWAKGLKKAGYATNPKYPQLLISLIEKNNLAQYDVLESLPIVVPVSIPDTRTVKREVLKHSIKLHENKIKYITVNKGDTYWKIAKEFELGLWQLYKYNDLSKEDLLLEGDILFLQPKKNRAKSKKYKVKNEDTLRTISQDHGVKLKSLCKKNNLGYDSDLKVGTFLNLR
jgi:LysM repeat protein